MAAAHLTKAVFQPKAIPIRAKNSQREVLSLTVLLSLNQTPPKQSPQVAFETAGTKKIMANCAKLTLL